MNTTYPSATLNQGGDRMNVDTETTRTTSISIEADVRFTADDWALYDVKGRHNAALTLNAAIEILLRKKHANLNEKMEQIDALFWAKDLRKFGASDTATRERICDMWCELGFQGEYQ